MAEEDMSTMGWLRYVLIFVSILIFALGSALVTYIAWVLSTSAASSHFLSGTLFFTYFLVAWGFFMFLTGLTGWVGSTIESPCIIKMYLVMLFVCLLTEVGTTIAMSATNVTDVLRSGWFEMNQGTRNLIQAHLHCCGYNGPKEFAYNNNPMDSSCYNSTQDGHLQLKPVGCGRRLEGWLSQHKIIWVSVAACITALQVMAAALSIFAIQKMRFSCSSTGSLVLDKEGASEDEDSEVTSSQMGCDL